MFLQLFLIIVTLHREAHETAFYILHTLVGEQKKMYNRCNRQAFGRRVKMYCRKTLMLQSNALVSNRKNDRTAPQVGST